MNEKIARVMDSAAPSWGVCDFEALRSRLIDCRAKSRLPEDAKRVITAVFPYLLSEENYENSNISKYAVVSDYHTVINSRLQKAVEELRELFPDDKFVTFTDNSPIPEVSAALLSGLGVMGENSLFIHEKYGTYVFIGEIVTTLPLECTGSEVKFCARCGKCREACPTHAIGDRGPDPSKCLSAINQKKGELTPEEEKLIKDSGCAWGCDICQTVCPMNRKAALSEIKEFIESAVPRVESGCEISGRAYEWRGKKVIERNIAILEKD
ncbi:MAG: epoxyqueuosine reductase [Clostridia bacterium]|nr:epoxyqueuosine reductase [Clostridia bacterium]